MRCATLSVRCSESFPEFHDANGQPVTFKRRLLSKCHDEAGGFTSAVNGVSSHVSNCEQVPGGV